MDHIDKPSYDLLEENWFFGNSLETKAKAKTKTMSRCYSDPNPMENEKISETKGNHNLKRTPSLPLSIGREKIEGEVRNRDSTSKGKSSLRKAKTSLQRAPPPPPPCVGRDEDVESEFSLSRLIRQASLISSDDLPPKHYSKEIKQCPSAPRYRPQTKPQPENNNIETFQEKKNQSIRVQNKLRRSISDVKFQQVQEHKETYYKFDKKYLNPIEIPCFQEKPRIGHGDSSSGDDMKAQLKYWAQAVAANVR